jgi:integrase
MRSDLLKRSRGTGSASAFCPLRAHQGPRDDRRQVMAWVEKRRSGYLVRWRDVEGRKKQRLFRVEPDALTFAESLPKRLTGVAQGVSLAEYMQATLSAAEDIRDSTRYHYVSMARKHIGPAIGHRPLDQVNVNDLRRFLGNMRAAGYSSSYRSVARFVLARTFKLAMREGLLVRNPLDAVPVHMPDRRPEVEPLEVQDVEALASAILPRYRAAVLVMAYAGLLVGEVGALTISNVNLLTREVRVLSGVARAGGRLAVTAPKTPASRRTVPLPRFLAQEVRVHVERFGLAPDGRVFHTPRVNQHADEFGLLHAASLHKPFKKARESVGLPHAHPHSLRHTYAALLIREGAHPKVLQALLGHTSVKVTLDLYGHLLPGLGQELAESLELRRAEMFCIPTTSFR